MQALVPAPILSLLLLYPITENTNKNPLGTLSADEKCFFMKQSISNACGTIAIIHALGNNTSALDLDCETSNTVFLSGIISYVHHSNDWERDFMRH